MKKYHIASNWPWHQTIISSCLEKCKKKQHNSSEQETDCKKTIFPKDATAPLRWDSLRFGLLPIVFFCSTRRQNMQSRYFPWRNFLRPSNSSNFTNFYFFFVRYILFKGKNLNLWKMNEKSLKFKKSGDSRIAHLHSEKLLHFIFVPWPKVECSVE